MTDNAEIHRYPNPDAEHLRPQLSGIQLGQFSLRYVKDKNILMLVKDSKEAFIQETMH